ncbi:peptide/nickel transport system substrate-binding protein [Crossiella equi]|uniref:Peptide/nickel transport system substrate-binding protein n=1 Tax=Crossiella equi TaxID=130796 RepID=A0ABS5A8Z3_9PSEU|nr:ABC transporter substrate-binding protein [Crossiella equi]MBP2472791.1 peptide/nickel transport system substrate-binding protein [Crossiella equi]
MTTWRTPLAADLSRRNLLRGLALGAAAVAGGPLLAACTTRPTEPLSTLGPPRPGGTLRVALVGTGQGETLQPFLGSTPMDISRARSIHGVLGYLDPNAPDGVQYQLLEGIDRAADLSAYTLRLRKGLKFTDGTPVTARDVLYSLAFGVSAGVGHYKKLLGDFDLAAGRTDGDHRLVLPTNRPIADGHLILCIGTAYIVKDRTTAIDEKTPTCGPFRLAEYEAGRGSRLVRNDTFAVGGLEAPRLDAVELMAINDADARLTALRGHQVDLAHDLTPAQAQLLSTDNSVRVLESAMSLSTGLGFQMHLAVPQFQDVRVRQAVKHAVDRKAAVETVLFGRGHVGNDLFALGFPDYAGEIQQRAYDPDKARALLREAGATNLRFSVSTGPETAGMVELATLLVDQLGKVGIRAKLDARPAGQLFTDYNAYSVLPFAATYSLAIPPTLYYQSLFSSGSPSSFGWNRPDVDALVNRARGQADPVERKRIAGQAQEIQWREGNSVVPVFRPILAAANPGVAPGDGLVEQYPTFQQTAFR